MKKINSFLFVLIALFATYSQAQAQGYTVKAKIDNPNHYGPYYFAYFQNGKFVIDTSSATENGWVIFKGKVSEPVVASFGVRGNPASYILLGNKMSIPGPSLDFFLGNEVIKIVGNADYIYMSKISGGKANEEWAKIKSKESDLTHQSWIALKYAYGNFKPGDDSVVFANADTLRSYNADKDVKIREEFVKENPNSLVSMYFLSGLVNTLSLNDLKAAYARLGNTHKHSEYAHQITDKIKSMDATAIGEKAIPIDKKGINGKQVTLQLLRGKYVLLVFWGSWCSPCRAEDPHLKELYAKYKKQGFDILGVAQEESQSLAENLKTWKKAVMEDGLPWMNVLNNEGIDKYDVVKEYGVTAFPTKILLNTEGKIVARYVGGDNAELDKKLKNIFEN